MISLDEQILTFSEAAALLPRRRAGKPVHISCIYRWTNSGCRGVILEAIQIGGTRCTSKEALDRFFMSLAGQPTLNGPKPGLSNRLLAAEANFQRRSR
ncbi:DUF1580 domain-containing protein [Anatilimnocola sp. NA78]|uniref:DUF1580 domain-containing protein n=1 Tax=Anatilimnocola sp. NA78 TaxID=3415683 RepID=UPI003CE503F7